MSDDNLNLDPQKTIKFLHAMIGITDEVDDLRDDAVKLVKNFDRILDRINSAIILFGEAAGRDMMDHLGSMVNYDRDKTKTYTKVADNLAPDTVVFARSFKDELQTKPFVYDDKQTGVRIKLDYRGDEIKLACEVRRGTGISENQVDIIGQYVAEGLSKNNIFDMAPSEIVERCKDAGIPVNISESIATGIKKALTFNKENQIHIREDSFSITNLTSERLVKCKSDVDRYLTDYVIGKMTYKECAKAISERVPISYRDARRLMCCLL